jgi:rfaE bifunctional protein nucleotidyltransferase chain/domain
LNTPCEKIMTMDSLLLWRENLQKEGRKLVVTNGCFDILHKGHVEYLFKSRSQGDALLVALNSDSSTRALKGPTRPVNDENSRALLLGSLYFVDAVYIFDTPRCTGIFEKVKPDIYVKGADYNIDTINPEEKNALQTIGAEIRFVDLTPGFSTTAIIEKMSK